MLKKIIAVLFLLCATLYAQQMRILPPEEAFSVSFEEQNGFVIVKIEMSDGVYLLADKLNIEVISPKKLNLTSALSSQKPEIFKEQNVYFDLYETAISKDYLRSNKISGKTLLKVDYQGCAGKGVICYPPLSAEYQTNVANGKGSQQSGIADMLQNSTLLAALVSFFGFGLLLSLTPCTFPMIPILSSIIAKQSKEHMTLKKGFWLSFVYVFFMSLAYMIAGIAAGYFGSNLQIYLQNPWAIATFSAIFVLLSLSMFGLYRLELPPSWQTKFSKLSGKGHGVLGVVLMGFVSSLIIGPCVAAPLAGALIYIGQSGDALLGGAALFVMSMGMGVPLLIVGASAGKFLPKPGFWMNVINRIFGFVMLGVAVYLLSRIIPADIALILWALLLFVFGVFLFITSAEFKIKKTLKTLAVVISVYGALLLAGGFLGGSSLNALANFELKSTPKLPLDFQEIENVDELELAIKKSAKPVMLEFTAAWCAICTEFEEKTLSKKSVQDALGGFTLLRVDVTKNSDEDRELMRRFSLFGPPAIIFFKEGAELADLQIVGFKNEAEFLEHLKRIEE
ncbi:MAG: protein-disulfide reductase DsbD [Campylobacteraceae bacterium]|jgi:thiol:disulfide interchange protein DsbD|nr:protein-disulfide reductase DsbD [Campylobacteraceae bacterium]